MMPTVVMKTCTAVMKVRVALGRRKMVTFFQMWWMKWSQRMAVTLVLPQTMKVVILL